MRRACYNLAYSRKNPYVFETAVFKNFIDSADFFNRRRGNRDNCLILRFAAKDGGDVFYRSKDRNSFYLSSSQFRVIVKKRAYFSENLFSFYIIGNCLSGKTCADYVKIFFILQRHSLIPTKNNSITTKSK